MNNNLTVELINDQQIRQLADLIANRLREEGTTGEPFFMNEAETAKYLGISRQSLQRLRYAREVIPDRQTPMIGYSPANRKALIEVMSDPAKWEAAMARARETPRQCDAPAN
ncbi:hypothetical protein AB1K70_17030 [Bremerella sp. JC770]|uniref:hypothetical protein n=1 Tax=Bremerella sp. JC770 TaxID=3232137 RepID=UPI00345B3B3B